MLSRQDRRQIILVYMAGLLLLCVCCMAAYKLLYVPARSELRYLHQTISDETPNKIEEHSMSLGEYQQWMSSLKVSQSGVRQGITTLVHAAAVRLIELRFDAKQKLKPFAEIPVFLKVKAGFPAIMTFFTHLANSHLIFSFRNLQLNKEGSSIIAAVHLQLRSVA
jgi:hypothetical protein